jgi:hypothetical protein
MLNAALAAHQQRPPPLRRLEKENLIWLPSDERNNHIESLNGGFEAE